MTIPASAGVAALIMHYLAMIRRKARPMVIVRSRRIGRIVRARLRIPYRMRDLELDGPWLGRRE